MILVKRINDIGKKNNDICEKNNKGNSGSVEQPLPTTLLPLDLLAAEEHKALQELQEVCLHFAQDSLHLRVRISNIYS